MLYFMAYDIFHFLQELDCFDYGLDWTGVTISSHPGVFSPRDCQNLCKSTVGCSIFVFQTTDRYCFLRASKTGAVTNVNVVSGPNQCSVYQGKFLHHHFLQNSIILPEECHFSNFLVQWQKLSF